MTGTGAVVALPLTPRPMVGLAGSLLENLRQAPAGRTPEIIGAKVTLRPALPPAARVKEPVGVQVIEPGVPAQDEIPVTVKSAVPVFCTWALSVFEPPAVTVWKSSAVG